MKSNNIERKSETMSNAAFFDPRAAGTGYGHGLHTPASLCLLRVL